MGNVWTLTLDTATPYLSLGLFRGEEGLGRVVRVERRHEEVLFGLLDETLEALGARREEIGALVLGRARAPTPACALPWRPGRALLWPWGPGSTV